MLGALLKEVRQALKSKNTNAPEIQSHLAELDQAFQKADLEGRLAAVEKIRQELARGPGQLEQWILLGDWLVQLQRYAEAEIPYREALKIKPLSGRAQEGLGLALLYLKRLEESYLHLETACKLDPTNTEALTHWGLVDLEMGNLGKAAAKFQRAIERAPGNAHAWQNLGLVAYRQGNAQLSMEYLERCIALKPDHGLAYSNLALAALRCDNYEKALDSAKKAVALKSTNSRVLLVHGEVLLNGGDFAEAAASLQRAIDLDNQSAGPRIGMAKLLASTGQYGEAAQCFERALLLHPNNAEAQAGLGQLKLLREEWSTGWDLYEARRRTETNPVRSKPFPAWEGEALTGKRILVHAEQGIGDVILFASCLADLEALGARCVAQVPARLVALLSRSFPGVQVLPDESSVEQDDSLSSEGTFDFHVPIGSLPRHFRRKRTDFPRRLSYLRADPDKTAEWRERLSALPGKKIGVTWRGGLLATALRQRSVALADLATALRDTGASLVCLQHGDVTEEITQLADRCGVKLHSGISGYADLDDVASLTSALDGVVTVCCTQAHLTGALGKQGLVLVPSNPNWRYGAAGDHSAWYPSLRLLRQSKSGEWRSELLQAAKWVATMEYSHG